MTSNEHCQGWRLDPLLLLGQLLTAGAALSFGVEALRLREIVHQKEVRGVSSSVCVPSRRGVKWSYDVISVYSCAITDDLNRCDLCACCNFQLSEAGEFDTEARQPGLDPRYPEALPLPHTRNEPQLQAQQEPQVSSSQGPLPWWKVRGMAP